MSKNTLIVKLNDSFAKYGTKNALQFYQGTRQTKQFSFAQLDGDSNRAADFFLKSGVAKGDRIILCLPKSVGFLIAYLATLKVNAVAVPLNPGFTKNELRYLITDAQAKLAVVGPDQKAIFKEIAPNLTTIETDPKADFETTALIQSDQTDPPPDNSAPEDPALIIYTSGTTGHPKGAVLTQENLIHDALNIINIWEITHKDVLCHALPLFHIHGLCFALNTALLCGSKTIMLETFSAKEVVARLACKDDHAACTIFMAVPAMYAKLIDHIGNKKIDFHHLRLLTCGSAPLLPKDFDRIEAAFGRKPVEREGMSETGMNFSNPLNSLKKSGSIGLPLPGLRVRVVNPKTFTDLPPGETGELWLKSPSIIKYYWQKPEESAAAFVDGWFRTGDLGYVDADGYYFLTDRIKHIIISGGENVSPKEVENVINKMTAVAESSVVGIFDETWGEKIVAAVTLLPGQSLSPDQIITHCKAFLHPWKCPKKVIITQQLPRNTMGKILKEAVKSLFI